MGLQVATIEACRHLLGLEGANSSEFDNTTKDPCVIFMPEHSATMMGGTMRLGSRCTIIQDTDSLASAIYGGQPVIYERHRHRYEVNTAYKRALENQGFYFSGQDERGVRMEIAEIRRPGWSASASSGFPRASELSSSASSIDRAASVESNGTPRPGSPTPKNVQEHPFFLAVQYHPEFKSRPNRPSPVFLAFVLASCGQLEARLEEGNGKLIVGAGFQRKVREVVVESEDKNIEKMVGA